MSAFYHYLPKICQVVTPKTPGENPRSPWVDIALTVGFAAFAAYISWLLHDPFWSTLLMCLMASFVIMQLRRWYRHKTK